MKELVIIYNDTSGTDHEFYVSEKIINDTVLYSGGKDNWYKVIANSEFEQFLSLNKSYEKIFACLSSQFRFSEKLKKIIGDKFVEINQSEGFGYKGIDIIHEYNYETILIRCRHCEKIEERKIKLDEVEIKVGDKGTYTSILSTPQLGTITQGIRYNFNLSIFALFLSGKQFPDPYHVTFPKISTDKKTFDLNSTRDALFKQFTLLLDIYEGFAKYDDVICRNNYLSELNYFKSIGNNVWIPFPMVRYIFMNNEFGAYKLSSYMIAPKIVLAFRNEFDLLDACNYSQLLKNYIQTYMLLYLLIDCKKNGISINAINFSSYEFWLPVEINDIKYKKREKNIIKE